MLRLPRLTAVLLLLLSVAASPAAAQDDGPSLLQYGWTGLTTGLGVGFATGYLAMGPTYQDNEWRSMVYGMGIGALVGVGTGLTLGLVDIGAAPDVPGFIVLRDIGYGSTLGAVGGLIVGILVAIGDEGELRDVSTGAAYGTLVGAGAGLVFGVIEAAIRSGGSRSDSAARETAPSQETLGLTLLGAEDAARRTVLMPAVYGTF